MLEPLSGAMRGAIERQGYSVDEDFTPLQQQFLQLMEASGISFTRPLGQQLDLLALWAERCADCMTKR